MAAMGVAIILIPIAGKPAPTDALTASRRSDRQAAPLAHQRIEPRRQRVQQLPHRRPHALAAGEGGLHQARRRRPAGQHLLQCTARQRLVRQQARQGGAAHAGQRGAQQRAMSSATRRGASGTSACAPPGPLSRQRPSSGELPRSSVGNCARSAGVAGGAALVSSAGAATSTCGLSARGLTTSSCGSAAPGARTRSARSTPSCQTSTLRLVACSCTLTSGQALRKRASMSLTACCSSAGGHDRRTVPRGAAVCSPASACTLAASASMARACCSVRWPMSVRAKRRVVRWIRRTPSAASSAAMRRLSLLLGMPVARSAAAKPPCSATWAK